MPYSPAPSPLLFLAPAAASLNVSEGSGGAAPGSPSSCRHLPHSALSSPLLPLKNELPRARLAQAGPPLLYTPCPCSCLPCEMRVRCVPSCGTRAAGASRSGQRRRPARHAYKRAFSSPRHSDVTRPPAVPLQAASPRGEPGPARFSPDLRVRASGVAALSTPSSRSRLRTSCGLACAFGSGSSPPLPPGRPLGDGAPGRAAARGQRQRTPAVRRRWRAVHWSECRDSERHGDAGFAAAGAAGATGQRAAGDVVA